MNFSFINSGLLFALPLVLIPVIIHLFSIKNSRVKKFPETKYIAQAVKKSITRIHLLQLLLLLLRVLIVALLVFFFAGTVLHKNANSAGPASPEAYYVLLDNSYSMGAVYKNSSSFDRGKNACLRVLKGLRKIDSVSFALFSNIAEPKLKGLTSEPAEVEKKIKTAGLSARSTSIKSGLSTALAALKQVPGVSKQIIVVTDLALHGYAQFAFAPGELDPKVNLVFIDVGETADNIAAANASAGISSFEDRLKFKVDIFGYTAARYSKVPVTLLLNGQKAAYGFAEVKPGRKTVKTLYAGAGESESSAGSVKLEVEDALALDNSSYFTVSGRQLKKILLVDGDSKISAFLSETFYLNLALNPNQRFSRELLPSVCVLNELKNKNLSEYKAVILCNIPELLPAEAGVLLTYLKNGGNLVYFLGDKIELKNYAALDSALFPAVIRGEEEGNFKIDGKTLSSGHPLLKNTDAGKLEEVSFSRVYRLAPRSKCFSYLDFAGLNCPAFLESGKISAASGRVLIFPFPADRDRTDFPLRNAYLPFMQELAKYLAEGKTQESPDALCAGELFKRKFEISGLSGSVEVTNPAGAVKKIVLQGNTFEYPFTDSPGIYSYRYADSKGRKKEYFSVNLDTGSGESDLKKLAPAELPKLFPPKTFVYLLKNGKKTERDIVALVRGEELSTPLLLALLFLLTAEGMLSLRRFL